ncbi:MAG TPA: hypothetical protein VKE41_10465 [Roseiflexaceae bacterium]|nr:hypothetical protein [Roseiflexaceae bacterium]
MSSQQDYKLSLQIFQSQRLRRDHADLAAEPQYRQIGEFFFKEMYGPQDFSSRDEQARRLHQFVHLAPGLAVRDVQDVLELLELTNQLDDAVAAQLAALKAPLDFDETTYERAYRLCDNYADRVRQIELIRKSLYNVYRMAHKPLIGAVLQRTRGLAQTVGMADIHRFLLLGYQAIQAVRDIYRFVETILLREQDRLDRIYET